MSITAVVENDMIKLPMHVPDGTKVEVLLPRETVAQELPGEERNALAWMKQFIGCIEGPEDFAAQHDHYIHGTPKRTEQ